MPAEAFAKAETRNLKPENSKPKRETCSVMLSVEGITVWVEEGLNQAFPAAVALVLEFAIVGLLMIGLFAVLGLVLVFMERKVSAHMQVRVGPNPGGVSGQTTDPADT